MTTRKKPEPAPQLPDNSAGFAELIARPRRRAVHVLGYDPNTVTDYTKLQGEQRDKARADLGVIEFELASIPATQYEELQNEHRSTGPQQKAHKDRGNTVPLLLNPDTFPGALAEATIIKVTLPSGVVMNRMTAEQYNALSDANFSDVELDELFQAVVVVNRSTATIRDLGKG